MAQFLTIGRHLECAIQTETVVELELALIKRKQWSGILEILENWQVLSDKVQSH